MAGLFTMSSTLQSVLQNFPPGLPISSLCHKHIYMIPGKDKSLHVEVNF